MNLQYFLCFLLFFYPHLNIMSQEHFKNLTEEEYKIIVEKGTERPYTGKYDSFFEAGTYHCKACNAALYRSTSKFNSHCGWPAFDDAIENAIQTEEDNSLLMKRTEILCTNCGGHLGHVFYGEGFTKTNTRHCVNSISLIFKPLITTSPQ